MKRLFFSITVALLLLSLYGESKAQQPITTFEYVYDNAGNRVVRRIIYLKSTTINDKKESEDTDNSDVSKKDGGFDKMGDIELSLYPNPTSDKVIVDIKGFNNSNGKIYVYDMKGNILFNQPLNSGSSIDFSSLPQGIYIVKILYENELKEWKIIRE